MAIKLNNAKLRLSGVVKMLNRFFRPFTIDKSTVSVDSTTVRVDRTEE